MTLQEVVLNLGGGAGVVGLLVAAARSKKVRAAIARALSDEAHVDLGEAVRSLQSVVEAQGHSIEWLREELTNTRTELEAARLQLAKTEALAIENAALRARVADLEAHVRKLEDELRRRRGGRPKKDDNA